MSSEYQMVFLIGAARSGTKLLRTILEQSEEVSVIPYDINYIWKYGNYNLEHDEMNDIYLTDKETTFIKTYIEKQAKKSEKKILIEKTVSNCLRVDFIKRVFPEAKIIHLYRDGRDVSLSAKSRWEGSIFDKEQQSKKDILQKLRDLPVLAVLPYLMNYVKINLKHFFSKQSTEVDSWGPVYKGMNEDKKQFSLLKVCALQWKNSVESTLKSLSQYTEGETYINIKYENLLSSPEKEIGNILTFLHLNKSKQISDFCEKKIKNNNMKKWVNLNEEDINVLESTLEGTLKKLNYNLD